MARSESVEVRVTDRETGEGDSAVVPPGDYCLVVTRPLRLVNTQRYSNGTVVLTLKREERKGDTGETGD